MDKAIAPYFRTYYFISVKLDYLPKNLLFVNIYLNILLLKGEKCVVTNMWQLSSLLDCLVGLTLAITTEYSRVSGILIEVKYDYVVLSVGSNLLYVPLTSIQNVAY